MSLTPPTNFQLFNQSNSKSPVIVVTIAGLNDILATDQVYTTLDYGDPITYGEPGLVYGGLRPYITPNGGQVRNYISLAGSSLSVSQQVEPEQGRASISQMSIAFIDKDLYMSKLISPGVVIPDIMGADVKVYLGYQELSYPSDYYLLFRGFVQGVTSAPGLVTLQFGDPNLKRRQNAFFLATSPLSSAVMSADTTINVVDNSQFPQQIIGPNGNYDPAITTYIMIDDEVIEVPATGYGTNQFTSCVRGARGTSAADHDNGTSVQATVQVGSSSYPDITGINPMDLALKIMLSGFGGPYLENQTIQSIVYMGAPSEFPAIPNGILLPENVDAIIDLGLAPGDYVTISGDTYPANNGTFTVQGLQPLPGEDGNQVIVVNGGPLVQSTNSPAVLSLRSQYDTFPTVFGVAMYPWEVDVAGHQYLKAIILNNISDNLSFYLTSTEDSAKTFIEQEIYLASAAYSVTKNGQCSVNMTLPPIAGQYLVTLNQDNVVNPANITTVRNLTSTRKFYNEVDWQYDPTDDGQTYLYTVDVVDSDSLSTIGISSALPITTNGVRNAITPPTALAQRIQLLLNRYKNSAVIINLTVNYGAANSINSGDIVILSDPNNILQITNMSNGTRSIGTALYEVINRTFDIATGNAQLQLLSDETFTANDRFATWAPSSMCGAAGNTTTFVSIVPSFGAIFGTNEFNKWINYIGMTLLFHNASHSVSSTSILQSVSPSNQLTLATPLSFTPDATTIVDFAGYSTSTDPTVDLIEKQIHCFFDRSAPVVSGISDTQFTINSGDLPYFVEGNPIIVHAPDWSVYSFPDANTVIDATIISISGTTITTTSLGFTPAAGYLCEVLAFNDGGLGYRFV